MPDGIVPCQIFFCVLNLKPPGRQRREPWPCLCLCWQMEHRRWGVDIALEPRRGHGPDFGEFFSAGEVAAEGPALLAGLAAAVAPAAWHTAPARAWPSRLRGAAPPFSVDPRLPV